MPNKVPRAYIDACYFIDVLRGRNDLVAIIGCHFNLAATKQLAGTFEPGDLVLAEQELNAFAVIGDHLVLARQHGCKVKIRL